MCHFQFPHQPNATKETQGQGPCLCLRCIVNVRHRLRKRPWQGRPDAWFILGYEIQTQTWAENPVCTCRCWPSPQEARRRVYLLYAHTHTCLCLCACAPPVVCVVDVGVHACIYSTRIRTRGTHIIHTNAKAKGTHTALAGFAALIFGYSGQISPDPGFSNPGRGRSTLRNPRGIRGRSTPLELGSGRVGSLAA